MHWKFVSLQMVIFVFFTCVTRKSWWHVGGVSSQKYGTYFPQWNRSHFFKMTRFHQLSIASSVCKVFAHKKHWNEACCFVYFYNMFSTKIFQWKVFFNSYFNLWILFRKMSSRKKHCRTSLLNRQPSVYTVASNTLWKTWIAQLIATSCIFFYWFSTMLQQNSFTFFTLLAFHFFFQPRKIFVQMSFCPNSCKKFPKKRRSTLSR